jgi:prolipoprotein diacylglyceryltransferase
MRPILFAIGTQFVYSYTVMIAVGVLLALGLSWRRVGQRPTLSQAERPYTTLQSTWFDAVLIMLAAGLVCGRIGFVIGAWDYFQIHPDEAWQLWQGGFSYHGALVGGLGALLVYSVVSSQNSVVSKYLGLLAPGFALLVAFGWAGCWLDGCAYGQATTLGWLAADLPDAYGVYAIRYQTQVGGMLTGLLALLLPWLLGRVWRVWQRPLRLFGLTLLLVSLGHLLVGLGRGDGLPLLWGWSVGLWLDGLLALAGFVAMFFGSLEIQRVEEV